MRKFLFALLICCLAATTAFAQVSVIETHLDEDKQQDEVIIVDNRDYDQGHIYIRINGEPDSQGRTPVQIELVNTSNSFEFLLFDRAWSKKELRKKEKVFFDKGIGDNALPVENLVLDASQGSLIPRDSGKYTFPNILVEEGKTYECKIPIHLAKPKPNLFSKRKKIVRDIATYTIIISVENKDEAYEKLKVDCESLLSVFNDALTHEEFCTHTKHPSSFYEQTQEYTDVKLNLKNQINTILWGVPNESKKYERYKALLDSLDQMDYALEQYKNEETHVCEKCSKPGKTGGNPGGSFWGNSGGNFGSNSGGKTGGNSGGKSGGNFGGNSSGNSDGEWGHKCNYCKLSLQTIYNKLVRHYQNLYNGDVKKSAIINEVNALHRCGTTHSNPKRANENSYKAGINEFYNTIKNYRP